MLQKSKSKTIAKFKFLILVPLMLGMLIYVSCSEDYRETERIPQTTDNGKVIELKVGDANNLTKEEKERRNEIINLLGTQGNASTLIITDGETFTRMAVDNVPPPPSSSNDTQSKVQEETSDVPFAVIEEVPVYPGCEGLDSNDARKECLSEKITAHVNKNFDTSLGKELGLSGINRIYVQFRINKNGLIEVIGARAPRPELEEEASRVMNSLPTLTPGKQKGENVGVLYSLPITFNAGE